MNFEQFVTFLSIFTVGMVAGMLVAFKIVQYGVAQKAALKKKFLRECGLDEQNRNMEEIFKRWLKANHPEATRGYF